MKKLAIVIPAYKVDFFETVLFSLAQQTCISLFILVRIVVEMILRVL